MNRFGFNDDTSYYSLKERDNNYVVKENDTLYQISKKFGIDPLDLIEANQLKNTLIYPNQVLIIPVMKDDKNLTYFEYLIKEGDTLDKISKNFMIDLNALTKYNDISKLVLEENQVLKIPKNRKKYQINDTDNLETILKKNRITLEELVNMNSDKWLKKGNVINV